MPDLGRRNMKDKQRIHLLREMVLKPDEKKLVDDVVTHGCHIIQVRADNEIPGWSYTIGLFEMLHQPEIIVIGLKEDLAHFLLNEIARRFKVGVRFSEGQRERELIANVECEFREVEKQWLRQVMGYAIWFYGGDDFPVLQCIYPDLSNRFPWEESFDSSLRGRQPLLFSPKQTTAVEEDCWAANDPGSSIFNWKFSDPPHTGVYTTERIMNSEEPILLVTHDVEDGAWQFHVPSESTIETAALVCFHHIADMDATIKELFDLPIGWCAKRNSVSDLWVREPHSSPPDENGEGSGRRAGC
jgi:hypothetical protein